MMAFIVMEFIGNRNVYNALREWLGTYALQPFMTKSSCVLLCGPIGVGKTTLVKEVAREIDKQILWITSANCNNNADLIDLFNKFTQQTIDTYWTDVGNSKCARCIVVDDWDVLMSNDRNVASSFQFILQKRKLQDCPIICICDSQTEKRLNEIKTICQTFRMRALDESDICIYLKDQFPDLHHGNIEKIADSCMGNLVHARELATQAMNHKPSHGTLGSDLGLGFIDRSPEGLSLYTSDGSVEKLKSLLALDPWMNPLRYHENFLKELKNSKACKIEKCKAMSNMLRAIIEWDHWAMTDNDGIALDVLAAELHYIRSTFARSTSLVVKDEDLMDFTKMLSQLSLQKKTLTTHFIDYDGHNLPCLEIPISLGSKGHYR